MANYFEVWIDGRCFLILYARDLTAALCTALDCFPRRAVKVRAARDFRFGEPR